MLLSPKQIEFVRCANHRWNFKGGATRSGKTYLDFKWIIPMRIRERVGMDGLSVILGVTKSTIERNVLEPMRNIYGDELVGVISSDNTARILAKNVTVWARKRYLRYQSFEALPSSTATAMR